MSSEDPIAPGNRVLVRTGRHVGKTGIVREVHRRSAQNRPGALVTVQFADGGIGNCIMRNLEKVKEPPNDTPLAKKGGRK